MAATCASSPTWTGSACCQRLIPDDFTAIQRVYTAWSAREKIGLLERLRRENKEGIVLKLLTAPYSPGKTSGSNDQLKYKLVESASFVVTQVHATKRSVSLGLSAMGRNRGSGPRHHPAQPADPGGGSGRGGALPLRLPPERQHLSALLSGRARGHRARRMHGQPVEVPPRSRRPPSGSDRSGSPPTPTTNPRRKRLGLLLYQRE